MKLGHGFFQYTISPTSPPSLDIFEHTLRAWPERVRFADSEAIFDFKIEER